MPASTPVSSSSDSQSPVIVRPLRRRRRVPRWGGPLGKFQTDITTTWCTTTLTWVPSVVTRYRTRDGVLTLISVPAVTRSRTRAAAEALHDLFSFDPSPAAVALAFDQVEVEVEQLEWVESE
jgi:hypothetical protein